MQSRLTAEQSAGVLGRWIPSAVAMAAAVIALTIPPFEASAKQARRAQPALVRAPGHERGAQAPLRQARTMTGPPPIVVAQCEDALYLVGIGSGQR